MSIKGFSVGGVVQRYDYTALDNLPQGQGVSDDLKAALLQLAQKVAYIDDQGQTYYDDLYDALYPEKTLLSIAANFQQGQAVVYNTDSLDSLKQYLTVTAIYDDASTETVPSSAYTLSGTLTTGTSVITVTYEGKTDAFNVTVTAAPIALTVTNNLTGCTTSNSATSVLENTSYTAVITASSGYTLVGATVSITMGGNDITTSAYSGGIITINSVTGALVISVAAAAVVLNSISAVYTQGGTVWSDDTLDSLKADLVVTAVYSDSTTQTVAAEGYTLSGTLDSASSTITVSYGGKTTTFTVAVTLVGNTNYASSDLNNLTRVNSQGRNGITDGVVWYKAVNSTDISNWSSWIADPKPTLWSSLENKRVRIRVSIRSANWAGEVADNNRVTLHMAVYKNASVTSLGSDNRCYSWGLDTSYKPNIDWDVFEKIMTLDPESATQNPGTPTSSSTVGFASFAETLHTVEIRSIEIVEVLN